LQKQSGTTSSSKSVAPEAKIETVLLANFFLPGLGSWRLGGKKRGVLIMAVMIFSVLMAGWSYASSLSNQIDAALDMSNDDAFDASFNSSGIVFWLVLAVAAFIYSFVDIYLLARNQKKSR
jgi:amino acid permease